MKLDMAFLWEAFFKILHAVPLTLELAVFAFILGLILGTVVALVRKYDVKILSKFFAFMVSFIRGTPLLLQLYIVYYSLPMLIDSIVAAAGYSKKVSDYVSSEFIVILALAINLSAYLSETVRSGLEAVNNGEIEAAYSLGMKTPMVIRRVILPQTVRICIPNFAVNLINVLHGSSLAFYVTLMEVTGTSQILAQDNWKYMETYLAAGLIYWALTIAIEIITRIMEKILNRHIVSVA